MELEEHKRSGRPKNRWMTCMKEDMTRKVANREMSRIKHFALFPNKIRIRTDR